MIVVDTDVLAIHHIFLWDSRRRENEEAYELLKENKAKTTIYNLLELCGLFSAANMADRVDRVLEAYLSGDELDVEFPPYPEDWGDFVELVINYLRRGLAFGDALVVLSSEAVGAETFITWNKKHFEGKIRAKVLTPKEFLLRKGANPWAYG